MARRKKKTKNKPGKKATKGAKAKVKKKKGGKKADAPVMDHVKYFAYACVRTAISACLVKAVMVWKSRIKVSLRHNSADQKLRMVTIEGKAAAVDGTVVNFHMHLYLYRDSLHSSEWMIDNDAVPLSTHHHLSIKHKGEKWKTVEVFFCREKKRGGRGDLPSARITKHEVNGRVVNCMYWTAADELIIVM